MSDIVAGQEPLEIRPEILPYATASPPCLARWFSISSVSILLFLCTFWVTLGLSKADGRPLVPLFLLSGVGLFTGAVLGLAGMIFRGKSKDRVALIVGIIGLSLNTIVLLGQIALVLIATLITISRLGQTPTVPAAPVQMQWQPQPSFDTYRPSRSYAPFPPYRSPQLPGQYQQPRMPPQPNRR